MPADRRALTSERRRLRDVDWVESTVSRLLFDQTAKNPALRAIVDRVESTVSRLLFDQVAKPRAARDSRL
ncbi:hypothetical protein CAC00_31205, partial [Raoultella ornithinolytica]